jgi:putative ATP-grasp target RiPP
VTAPPHGPAYPASPDRPLTPGEALAKLFLDNEDRGANTANDALIHELQQRIRALRPTRKHPDRPLVERSPRQLPAAGRHHSGRSDPGSGSVDAAGPVGYAHGSAASPTHRRCMVESHDCSTGAVMFPASDHFPLGRAYGRIDATPVPPSEVRPFGLTLAVQPRTSIRFNPDELEYDDVRQIGLICDGEEMVPLSKHTDGTTSTQTNSDGHGGRDSDTDHRED